MLRINIIHSQKCVE